MSRKPTGTATQEVAEEFEIRYLVLHGHRVAYRQAGSGPVMVLVHGITSNSTTWQRVMPYLARRFTVIAPDLLGHGESAKPKGDYSLRAGTDIEEIARGHATLADSETRGAFVHTLRSVVEPGGQRVDASDRLYLAGHIPSC